MTISEVITDTIHWPETLHVIFLVIVIHVGDKLVVGINFVNLLFCFVVKQG